MNDIEIVNAAIESWGLIFCIIGIIGVTITAKADKSQRKQIISLYACTAFFLLSNVVTAVFEGGNGATSNTMIHVGLCMRCVSSFCLVAIFTDYLVQTVYSYTEKKLRWNYTVGGVTAVMILTVIANEKFGFYYTVSPDSTYKRGDLFWLTQLVPALIIACDLIILLVNNRKVGYRTSALFTIYTVLPLAAITAGYFIPDIELISVSLTISALIIYLNVQMDVTDKLLYREKELSRKNEELSEERTKLIMSQIQPHFLFNSITSIMLLCKKAPDKAVTALTDFSSYLRGNMQTLTVRELIPFSEELKHTETYLRLEQLRFSEKLNIEYDIKEKDFMIPPLTLQPLVENAVKHGVGQKKEGGTVTISTHSENENVIIEVKDDGVGFDTGKVNDVMYGDGHIGIYCVKSRLASMCGGTLELKSIPGTGTDAVVTVPLTKASGKV